MTKRIFTLIALCIVGITAALAQQKAYSLNIGDFKEFTVSDHLNVDYKYSADSAGYATFVCERKIAPAITFTNKGGKLKIEVISETPITEPLPTVTIYSSSLEKATNHGDSTVCLVSVNPSYKLALKAVGNGMLKALNIKVEEFSAASEAGSGHIYANGQCSEASYTILGAGVIECGAMTAPKVKVKMAGTGSVDCSASEQLTVYGLGSGSVYYAGDPEIKRRNLGVKLVPIK